MAVTATTTLSATDYTTKASQATGCYLNDWYTDPLKIKTAPNGSLLEYYNHRNTSYSNRSFTVKEIIGYDYGGTNQWCRTNYANPSYCGYRQNDGQYWVNLNGGTVSCTYGQIRVTGGTITCSRTASNSKTVSVSATINYQIAQAPIESYYDWKVYVFLQAPDGKGIPEMQQYIVNTSKSWSTGTGTKTFSYTFEDDSGNTSLSCGHYGIWGNNLSSSHSFRGDYNQGASKQLTMNIPKYVAYVSPVRQYNGSSWDTIDIKSGTGDTLAVKQYNGSSWVDL